MSQFLRELYGIDTDNNPENRRVEPFEPSSRRSQDGYNTGQQMDQTEIEVEKQRRQTKRESDFPELSFTLSSWQKWFYKKIKYNIDSFIAVPPAAGKTLPMLKLFHDAFRTAMFGGNRRIDPKSKQFPRIAFVVPTKQLAMQIAIQDFVNDKDFGLKRIIYEFSHLMPGLGVRLYNRDGSRRDISRHEIEKIERFVREFIPLEVVGIKVGSGVSGFHSSWAKHESLSVFGLKPIVVGTYESMSDFISQYSSYYNIIAIDETQQSIPLPGQLSTTDDDISKYKAYHKIFSSISKQGIAGLHLMSGSMNKNTAEELTSFLNKKFNRSIEYRTEFGSGAQAINRSNITVMPTANYTVRRPDTLVKLVTEVVSAQQKNSILVIFAVKRASKTGIFRIAEDIIDLLPKRNINALLPSMKEKEKYDKETIKYEEPISDQSQTIGKNKNKEILESDVEFLKRFNVESAEQKSMDDPDVGLLPDGTKDENNILYQALLRGVGLLSGPMNNRHKMIVQKLFRNGDIYMLLATDALGIGANVKCKHLYIPSIDKPPLFGPIDSSSLVQLVNRAGRSNDIPNAFVYCQPEEYDNVKRLILKDPSIEVDEINPIPYGSFKEASKHVDDSSLLQTAFRLFTG